MKPRGLIAVYVFSDWLAGVASWTILFAFRKVVFEQAHALDASIIMSDGRYQLGLALVPMFWLVLHALAGMYLRPMRRHRILELGQVAMTTLVGVLVLFLTLVLDDAVVSYRQYYASLSVLFLGHGSLTLLGRMVVTTRTVKKIHQGRWSFRTLVIGGNETALRTIEEMKSLAQNPGFDFKGFIQANGSDTQLEKVMPNLGNVSNLGHVIRNHRIQEVIIAIASSDHAILERVLNQLEGNPVTVRIIPDNYDILSGSVRMSSIYGAPLIEIDREFMPQWQRYLKRMMDWLLSILALVLLSPVLIAIGLTVWATSKGPVFFLQERIGRHGKPFNIIKFRTMVEDAEKAGPQLSSENDPRITQVGKFLRKSRLDELPQFVNVLKGDMALVGPRPERAHFIAQIVERAPHYNHLQKVRPGITSWGQVKYGYAENVDQMIQRLRFDLIYIENMSIALDIKILFYTVLTVLKGRGK